LLVRACILIERTNIDLEGITKSPYEKTEKSQKVKLNAADWQVSCIMCVTKNVSIK
jgi:hypothetical protein